MIGDAGIAQVIADIVQPYPQIPLVLDPILAAGGGQELATQALQQVMVQQLLPLTRIITPNTHEARRLTGLQDLNDCAGKCKPGGRIMC